MPQNAAYQPPIISEPLLSSPGDRNLTRNYQEECDEFRGVAVYMFPSSLTCSEDAQLINPSLISDSSSTPAPSVRFDPSTMSQDAEDGPELIVCGSSSYTTRAPMNQDEFDRRFAYSRPTHRRSALARGAHRCARTYYKPCTSWRRFANTVCGFVPILRWLPAYSWRTDFLADVVGGFTVGVMHVPQGIAYAILANVPPIVGLYTSFFPPLFYMLFGTSRHNSIGSFAVVSLMAGMTVDEAISAGYGLTDTTEIGSTVPTSLADSPAVVVSSTLALCVGLVQLLMGLFRLEILTTYFSDQLIAGFTTAASCHVFVAQLRDFFGIRVPRRFGPGNLFQKLYDTAANIHRVNLSTLGISVSTLVFLVLAKDILSPFLRLRGVYLPLPFELIVVVLWTVISTLFDLNGNFGVRIVHSIPTGLPQALVPDFALLPQLIPNAISISIVIIAVHISLAKMFAKKLSYRVDPGQELYAVGLSASLASFFPVYPVSCSLGRTIVNVEAGTKTQLSTIFSSFLLGSVIIYLGHYLRALPMCVLTAIIIVALKGMTQKFKDLVMLWPLSKIDFSIWLVSFVATLAWDVTEGLAVSICFALLTTVFRTQWPRWHYLANLIGTNDFRDAERYHRVRDHSGICIFRFDSPLLFTNVDRFKNNINEAFEKWRKQCPHYLTEQDLQIIPLPSGPDSRAESSPLPASHIPIGKKGSEEEYESRVESPDAKQPTIVESKSETSVLSLDHLNTVISTRSQSTPYIPANKPMAGLLYRHFIIDCSGFTFVDYMGVNAIKEIFQEMRDQKVLVYFAAAKAPVRDLFEKSGFYQNVPKTNFYPTIRDAVAIARKRRNASTLQLLEELSLPYDRLTDAISTQPMN